MKYSILCILLLIPLNWVNAAGLGTITDCFFIDNNTESVELVGIQTPKPYPTSNCFAQFFNDVSWEVNRSNVKMLKTGAIAGISLNEKLFKTFKNLRVLDISNFGAEYLTSDALNMKSLEKLIASHNNLTSISEWIFLNLLNLTEIDFSFNKITALYATNLKRTAKVAIMNFSHNKINILASATFQNLKELRILDLSNNFIVTIDKGQFNLNSKLEVLRLDNNPIIRFDCDFFESVAMTIKVNISLNQVRKINTSCLKTSIQISLDDGEHVTFHVPKSGSQMQCSTNHFKTVNYLNISGNELKNTPKIVEMLGSSVESLDVASNFIGKLNANTFKRLNNLQFLNLSRTNLTNFGFKTFYHQNKLKILDLSFNGLKKVNFTLLLRNFRHLQTLNLEGNDLTEINSVSRANFPVLTALGISKNDFSCDYLATFLRQWENLQLFHNPSDDTHIDGVDCYHDHQENEDSVGHAAEGVEAEDDGSGEVGSGEVGSEIDWTTDGMETGTMQFKTTKASEVLIKSDAVKNDPKSIPKFDLTTEIPKVEKWQFENVESKVAPGKFESTDTSLAFRIIERIGLVICLACCAYLMMKKSKVLHEIKQKLMRLSLVRNASYQQDERGSQCDFVLMDREGNLLNPI